MPPDPVFSRREGWEGAGQFLLLVPLPPFADKEARAQSWEVHSPRSQSLLAARRDLKEA